MVVNFRNKVCALWKYLNNTSLRDFAVNLSKQSASNVVSALLIMLCVLPLFVSLTAKGEQFSMQGLASHFFYEGVSFSIICAGDYWFQCILVLSTALLFMIVLNGIKYFYQKDICAEGKAKQKLSAFNVLPVCLCMTLAWSVLSAFFSNDKIYGFLGTSYRHDGVLTYLIYGIVFCAAGMVDARQYKNIAEVLTGVCAFTGLLAIDKGRLLGEIFSLITPDESVMFHQYNHYGYFLAICAPIAFGLALTDFSGPVKKCIRILELWLIFNAAVYNGTRGSFLAIVLVVICWNVIVCCFHREKYKCLLILDFLFVTTLLFLNTGNDITPRLAELFQQMVQATQNTGAAQQAASIDGMGSGRVGLWKLGCRFAMERPMFGYGPENLGACYDLYVSYGEDRPHNEFIQIAASLGIPALLFYLTGLAGHFVNFVRCIKKLSLVELTLFSSVLGYLASSFFGNSMFYTTPYFYMMLGFTYSICKNKETKTR